MEMEEKRLRELALRAAHTGSPAYTRFLEAPTENACRAAANSAAAKWPLMAAGRARSAAWQGFIPAITGTFLPHPPPAP